MDASVIFAIIFLAMILLLPVFALCLVLLYFQEKEQLKKNQEEIANIFAQARTDHKNFWLEVENIILTHRLEERERSAKSLGHTNSFRR